MTFSAFTTVAGNGKAGYSGDGRPASEGQFSEAHDVVVDTDVEISTSPDCGNNRIRKVTKEGVISTVVGNGIRGYGADGGPATCMRICNHAAVGV
jgi:hypothetical protein